MKHRGVRGLVWTVLEKVLSSAQHIPIDCFKAPKLVTLGYIKSCCLKFHSSLQDFIRGVILAT